MHIPLPADMFYKLLRKHLPERLYTRIQNSVGRKKKIFTTLEHYRYVAKKYCQRLNVKNRNILEIGAGNQIGTAIMLILSGAKEVYLADRISDNHLIVNQKTEPVKFINQIRGKNDIPAKEILSRIHLIDAYFTESEKIFACLPENMAFDCIVSHQVLEHIDALERVFLNIKQILKPGGYMFHAVDLTDHHYHIFDKFTQLKALNTRNCLNHLAYASTLWQRINDTKCIPMNRLLLPSYIELCERFGFAVTNLATTYFEHDVKIHQNILDQIPSHYKTGKWLKVKDFELTVINNCKIRGTACHSFKGTLPNENIIAEPTI